MKKPKKSRFESNKEIMFIVMMHADAMHQLLKSQLDTNTLDLDIAHDVSESVRRILVRDFKINFNKLNDKAVALYQKMCNESRKKLKETYSNE